MLSFTFCVVRYKGDWTKAYHYAAVLLAESRWSKVKTFDIYHALACVADALNLLYKRD